jgi:hypothetical protein
MPFRLTWEPAGVYREYLGDVTVADRRASLEAICSDRRFDDLRYSITDFLAVRSYEVSRLASLEIAALHIAPLATNPSIVMAAVAQSSEHLLAIQQFKDHGLTRVPYQVFPTLAEARLWVGRVTGLHIVD